MAQTGYTPILIYSSSTAAAAPAAGSLTNSTLGSELAINITDGKLFYKDNANAVQVIGWKTVPTTAGGTGLTSYTAGDLLFYASGTTLSKLAIGTTGQWLGSSGTAPQWNSPAALTKTDDTNVTLTLGGSASTALLNAASLTLGWTGQLAVTRGGTGLATVAQGDILYGSAANTLVALAKNTTATRYLSNTGSSNNPAWAQVDLTNGVTGTLPTGNGGTGLTSFTANGIVYASSTSALATSSNLVYNGTNAALGTSTVVNFGAGYTSLAINNTTGGGVAFVQSNTQRGSIFNGASTMYIDVSTAGAVLKFRNTATGGDTSIGADGVYGTTVGATNRDVFVDNTGLLGYVASTERSKKNIVDLDNVDWLLNLQPKSFNRRKKEILFTETGDPYQGENYTDEIFDELEYGLIAEQVEPINEKLCFYDVKTNKDTNEQIMVLAGIHYSKLIIPMLKKIQQQEEKIKILEGKL